MAKTTYRRKSYWVYSFRGLVLEHHGRKHGNRQVGRHGARAVAKNLYVRTITTAERGDREESERGR